MGNSINVIELIEDGFVSMGVNTLKSITHISEIGSSRYSRIYECVKMNAICVRNPYLEIMGSVLNLAKYNAISDPTVPFLYPLFVVWNNCMTDMLCGDEHISMERIFGKIKLCADRSYSSDDLSDLFSCMNYLIKKVPVKRVLELIQQDVYHATENAYELYLDTYVSKKHKYESHILPDVLNQVIATGSSEDIKPTKKTTCGLLYPNMNEAVKEMKSLRYNRRIFSDIQLLSYAEKSGIDATALSDALNWNSDAIQY